MTEFEKMKNGLPCDSTCDDFFEAKDKAQEIVYEYNQTKPSEKSKRTELLKKLFGDCSDQTIIEPHFHCDYGFNVHTKGFVFINYNCTMLDTAPIFIEENAFIGPGVCFACPQHSLNSVERRNGIGQSKEIVLKSDVWIGANCTIMGGVHIGSGSIIGAGSVVTKDIPDGVIAVGSPCKVLRKVTEKDKMLK